MMCPVQIERLSLSGKFLPALLLRVVADGEFFRRTCLHEVCFMVRYGDLAHTTVLGQEGQDHHPDFGDVCCALLAAGLLAFGAQSIEMKLMRQRLKAVLAADLIAQLAELVAVELDHLPRGDAD